MLQKTIRHYLMLQLIYGSSVKVKLLYAVPFILTYQSCNVIYPKRSYAKVKLLRQQNLILAYLFILGHKKKPPQKVHVSVQSVKANMDMQTGVQDPCCNCVLFIFLLLNFVMIPRDILRTYYKGIREVKQLADIN